MQATALIGIVALGALAFLAVASEAQAATASTYTCTSIEAFGAISTDSARIWRIFDTTPPFTTCIPGGGTPPIKDVEQGQSITLTCTETTVGAAPPLGEDAIVVKGVIDNTNFGADVPAHIWTWSPPDCGAGPQTNTVFCTSDGTSGGSPRFGVVRIHLRVSRTAGYDFNSEEADNVAINGQRGFVGIYRCLAHPDTYTDGNTATSPSAYVGGDTFRTSFNVSQGQVYNTGDLATATLLCGASSVTQSSGFSPTSTASTFDTVIEGSPSAWPTGCTLTQRVAITRNSAISLYSTTKYTAWSQTNPCSGCSFPDASTVQRAPKSLDRILTHTGTCAVSVDGTATTLIPRGEDVDVASCGPWRNARSEDVATNVAARAWILRNTTYRITTDFGSFDGLFGASASFPSNNVATTTATDTSENAGLQYHQMVETFSTTARTDSVLRNWGNTTDILDVESVGSWASVNNAKSPGGANASVFTIGDNSEFVQPRGLRDSATNLVSGATTTCELVDPNGMDSEVSHGTTDGSGHASEVQYTPEPPSGLWDLTCTATWSGNTAAYHIQFTYASPFTGDKAVLIDWRVVGSTLTIGAGVRTVIDDNTGIGLDAFDDANDVRYRVYGRECDGCPFYLITQGFLVKTANANSWATNVTLPGNTTRYFHANAWGNFTGQPLLGVETIAPLSTGASNLTPAQEEEVIALAAFFGTPFIYGLPFFAGALALALLMRKTTGILPNVVLLMVTLGATFAITTSKEELDAADPLFSPILIILYLALVLMQVFRWASGGINETHS